jgi:hypothetical protein
MRLARGHRLGLAVVAAVYLAACVVILGVGHHPLRPLYEGIGPAPPYRWVNPPAQFKATNIQPIPVTQTLQLTSKGSTQTGVATPEGQLVLSFPTGAIPPSPGDTSATVSITPLDPAKLGPLPPGLYADGNAYLVEVSYRPSGTRVTAAAKPVDAIIATPVPSVALLSSPDGKTWHRIPDHHIPRQAAVATTLVAFGHLLTASNVPVVIKPVGGGSRVALVVVLGLVAAIPLVAILIWRYRRRDRTP